MTLRVTLEIVPFGNEEEKYKIEELDIYNTGVVEDLGFGHQLCSYGFHFKDVDPQSSTTSEVYKSGSLEGTHNRRDGALELVRKVLEQTKEEE